MVAAGETVIEIYKFHDFTGTFCPETSVIERLILGGNDYMIRNML